MENYCTLGEIKRRIWPTGTTPDNDEDGILTGMISAASRMIDNFTGQKFYADTMASARYFTAYAATRIVVPPFVSLTTLQTAANGDGVFDATWSAGDYVLYPYNAAMDDQPYYAIETTLNSLYYFVPYNRSVKVTAVWGWPAVPWPIREACLIQAQRMYKRRDAPLGVISNPVGGSMTVLDRLDGDVAQAINPYRVNWI